ncbi:MAG TPA: ABC transporter permease subunit [Flavobacteriaceae bacterium]|jgi:hypothetical protein|nr:ABC transporter permease subunit [Flavobacteriaceae bacterium]
MYRLLSVEYHKFKHNKAARAITIAYFILICFIAFISSVKIFGFRLADQGIFNFPYIWHLNTWMAALLKIFLAIVIVSMVANEYSYRTLKQNLIDGLSKKEFLISKLSMVLVLSAFSTLFVFVVSLILGLIFSDYNEPGIIFSDMEYLLAYFVKLISFFSFCLFLGILIKRSAFALGFLFMWFIVENVVYGLLKWEIYRDTDIADSVSAFFPLQSMSNLIVEPITRLGFIKSAANQIGQEVIKDYAVHWYTLLIALFWAFVFIYLSYKLLQKRDL